MKLCVVREPWRAHPLAWIHRGEAAAIAAELQAAGHSVTLSTAPRPGESILLRLSDPAMLASCRSLTDAGVSYLGPRTAVMERCYDKYEACRLVAATGLDVPATALASDAGSIGPPLVLKPRRGSDSIGVRFPSRVPARLGEDHLVQRRIHGTDVTVAVLRGRIGAPLRILLPEGAPYTFTRKYLVRPGRAPLEDAALARRAHDAAARITDLLGSDWAARVDFLLEGRTGRLFFLECDVAPLLGSASAFTESLAAAGIGRAEQLRLLVEPE